MNVSDFLMGFKSFLMIFSMLRKEVSVVKRKKTDRQTDRQTDRDRDRDTDRQTDRQTDRHTDRHTDIQTYKTYRHTDIRIRRRSF